MRIGKRMWEVLEALNSYETKKGLTITEIIMKIKSLKPYLFPPDERHTKPHRKYVQAELASALRGESVSYPYRGCFDGDKLYALYSRSIKLLYKNKLIFPLGNQKTNRRRYKIAVGGKIALLVWR